jgi:hypothetical protein
MCQLKNLQSVKIPHETAVTYDAGVRGVKKEWSFPFLQWIVVIPNEELKNTLVSSKPEIKVLSSTFYKYLEYLVW